jgi:hypothetical protein
MKTTSAISLADLIVRAKIKILIVHNELHSIENAKDLNSDCLKSLITDPFWRIESKFVYIRSINNSSNFIFGSNNHLPFKIENGDPKYFIFCAVATLSVISVILQT